MTAVDMTCTHILEDTWEKEQIATSSSIRTRASGSSRSAPADTCHQNRPSGIATHVLGDSTAGYSPHPGTPLLWTRQHGSTVVHGALARRLLARPARRGLVIIGSPRSATRPPCRLCLHLTAKFIYICMCYISSKYIRLAV
jgi:hypothetical protein